MGREEEVREKWGHACRSDNNRAIGFSGGPWLLVAKLRGWGGWVWEAGRAGCAGRAKQS